MDMLTKLVESGQKVEYQLARVGAENSSSDAGVTAQKRYVSTVYEILSDDRLEITMPMEKTKLILLPVGWEYTLCFYTKSGLFQCDARIIDRYKADNVYILAMELTSNLRKFQRREYYRLSCILDMDSRKLEEEEIKAVENKKNFLIPGLPLRRSAIVDISGGGLRFVATQPYERDCLICCTYHLQTKHGTKEYNLVGKVLAVQELERSPGSFEHRVEFINIDVDVREEIIRYIFEEERKARHNGK